MLSSVLRSVRAVKVNIEIMRAFVRIREMLGTHIELVEILAGMEEEEYRFRACLICQL